MSQEGPDWSVRRPRPPSSNGHMGNDADYRATAGWNGEGHDPAQELGGASHFDE